MLEQHYRALTPDFQMLYTDVAANPSLKIILTNEKENLETQVLKLYKLKEESNEDFILRHARLTERLLVINELLEININHIKFIQQGK